jgi:poly-gamma-glutamate synthesis protein (capsule biosynthesis protein)
MLDHAVSTMLTRRSFLARTGVTLLTCAAAGRLGAGETARESEPGSKSMSQPFEPSGTDAQGITLFLCGDVMTGRGIDQVLPHPSKPHIFEPYMRSASGYVELAEQITGPFKRPVEFAYIWGDALAELDRMRPDKRIINLETAVTTAEDAWPKGINYRMHPGNIGCITAAKIDCCALANNHVLDWGYKGLEETLDSLHGAGMRTAGAGRNDTDASAAAVLDVPDKGRVLVFAFGTEGSGVPRNWAASRNRAGVNFIPDLSARTADRIAEKVLPVKRGGDIIVASIHWGSNWGYHVSQEERAFAQRLIDAGGVDVVHGHSSHHPKAIEIYRDRPILYGCGDFLNDYEGISGHESYRPDLALMYFPTFDARTGNLVRFLMTPTQIRRFRVNYAREGDARWLEALLNREGKAFATAVERQPDNRLLLRRR